MFPTLPAVDGSPDAAVRTLLRKSRENDAALRRMKHDRMAPIILSGNHGFTLPGDAAIERCIQTTRAFLGTDFGKAHAPNQQMFGIERINRDDADTARNSRAL